MRVWRVSRYRALDGIGGQLVEGRWHTRGHLVTYAAEHAATAELEWLIHLSVGFDDTPKVIPFSEIEIPDDAATQQIAESGLPSNWRANFAATQNIGDAWLDSRRTALLFVPCAIAPARNVLLNPMHPDSTRMRVISTFDFPFDARLLKGLP